MATTEIQKRLYTRREAAVYLAMSERELDRRVAHSQLTAVRDGRAIKFDRNELDRFIAALPSYEPAST